MTDNEKMREAVAAATKIVENPHGYTETSVLVASALLEQAAKSVPDAEIMDSRCTYSAFAGHVCNKCGRIHDGAKSVPVMEDLGHRLKLTEIRLGNNSAGWIGSHTDDGKVFVDAAELERLRKDAERPNCTTCANRGRVNGLSQETYCDGCVWHESWRTNHYKAAIGEKK